MATEILMLNDDCLLEIFKYLSLHDLANFKEIYRSLGDVVDVQFIRITRGSIYLSCDANTNKNLQIIKQFGSSVRRLTLHYLILRSISWYSPEWSEIFSTINEHCNNLKSLTVTTITQADVRLIANILKNVKRIYLGSYSLDVPLEIVNILSYCENVSSITLYSKINVNLQPKIFQRNQNLLRLELNETIKDSNLKTIVDNLMNSRLEEFYVSVKAITSSDGNLFELLRLNYLKRLCIYCYSLDIGPFLRNVDAFHSLNVLSLSNAILNGNDVVTLARTTRLKVLKLGPFSRCATSSSFECVLDLCGNKNFEHLIFLCYSHRNIDTMDAAKYLELVEKRNASTAEKCLHLTLNHDIHVACLNSIRSELLEANKGTIKLIDRWDRDYEYYNIGEF